MIKFWNINDDAQVSFPVSAATSLQGKLGPPNTPDVAFRARRDHINKEKLDKHREMFIREKHAPWDLTRGIMGPGQSA